MTGAGPRAVGAGRDARGRTGLVHEACLCSGGAAVAARCVAFVEAGLAAGEPVLVVCSEPTRQAVARALGADVARLAGVADAGSRWEGGHATMLQWDRDLQDLARFGAPWRMVVEPVWVAGEEGQGWHVFESVANRAYADWPCYTLCLHDAGHLGAATLDAVRRTHPVVSRDLRAPRLSDAYEEPARYVVGAERAVPPPAGRETAGCRVHAPAEARRAVRRQAAGHLGEEALDAATLAATELVTNALRVADSAEVVSWSDGDRWYLRVADDGPGGIDPLAGYTPPGRLGRSGRGLWLVRALADGWWVRSGRAGSEVGLAFGSSPDRAAPAGTVWSGPGVASRDDDLAPCDPRSAAGLRLGVPPGEGGGPAQRGGPHRRR